MPRFVSGFLGHLILKTAWPSPYVNSLGCTSRPTIPERCPGLSTGMSSPLQSVMFEGELNVARNATAECLFDVQLKNDYYTEYFKETEPMYVKPREFQIVNRMGPPYSTWKGPVVSRS